MIGAAPQGQPKPGTEFVGTVEETLPLGLQPGAIRRRVLPR